jgi:hypothetical protein
MKTKTFFLLLMMYFTSAVIAQPVINFAGFTNNPILQPSAGQWDADAVFTPKVILYDNTIIMFYNGSVDAFNQPISIGYATSEDGFSFDKEIINSPILEGDGTGFDAWSVSLGAVYNNDGQWLLFYAGKSSASTAMENAIGRATATDLNGPWTRLEDPILEVGSETEWDSHFIYPQSIILVENEYYLYYWAGNAYPGGTWYLGLATSTNGIDWTKYDDPATTDPPFSESDPILGPSINGQFDQSSIVGCSVNKKDIGYEMFFGGWNESIAECSIGYATSLDGVAWAKDDENNPIYAWNDDPYASAQNFHVIELPSVIVTGSNYCVYYDYFTASGEIGVATSEAVSSIIHVPDDQPTIQAAIDVATDGDTVLVAQGTYFENINFLGKAITVASYYLMEPDSAHIYNTVIDGSQPEDPERAAVVTLESGEDTTSVIQGFTIQGGMGNLVVDQNVRGGGGLFFDGSGAKIINNIIRNNTLDSDGYCYGGGISQGPLNCTAYIVISDNVIYNNSTTAELESMGGGIYTNGPTILENCIITNNTCHSNSDRSAAGGVILGGLSETYVHIINNTISFNTVSSNTTQNEAVVCGGMWIYMCFGLVSSNTIEGNTISSNHQGWAPGVHIGFCDTDLVFEKNSVIHNTTESGSSFGGGICLWQGCATLNRNLIAGNTGSHGGGIYISNPNSDLAILDHNTIVDNSAISYGGAIYIDDGDLLVTNSILWGNTSTLSNQIIGPTAAVNYSDVEMEDTNTYPGEGNINEDPLFADPVNGDYLLTVSSPCIDAGDPACPPDPDLTRCDMGAYYYDYVTLYNVPAYVPTIQEGINRATGGDTVLVADGTYFENINFLGKSITVASHFLINGNEDHITNTIIDGSQPSIPALASVVSFFSEETENSILTGFTITGGTGYYMPAGGGWPAIRAGGGIAVNLAGPTISYNRIVNNSAICEEGMSDGAGISCGPPMTPYHITIEHNVIENNHSNSLMNPGAAGISVFGPATIKNNVISNNLCEADSSQCGPSGLLCAYGTVTVEDNEIIHNKAYSHYNTPTKLGGIGAGAGMLFANGLVKGNTIAHNRVKAAPGDTSFAAGILVEYCPTEILLDGNFIHHNGFDGDFSYGGGMAIWYGGATLHNNMIYGDSATYGAGICMFDTNAVAAQVDIVNNTVTGNVASHGGNGLFAHRTGVNAVNTIFWSPDNSSVSEVMTESSETDITYSLIHGNWNGQGNIDADPLFVDAANFNFHLSEQSPCVNAGTNNVIYPLLDFEGDDRPYENTPVDIGADESDYLVGIFIQAIENNTCELTIKPNPVKQTATIEYKILQKGWIQISVCDLSGKTVKILEDKYSDKGTFRLLWNISGLEKGIYLVRLKSDGGIASQKAVIME